MFRRQDKPEDSVPAYETEGKNKIFYHATERENVDNILLNGLRAPVYMMNGRATVGRQERNAREQNAKFGSYPGGHQVLLRIKLPKDWPLLLDEASLTPEYVRSMEPIPPEYINVDNSHWP